MSLSYQNVSILDCRVTLRALERSCSYVTLSALWAQVLAWVQTNLSFTWWLVSKGQEQGSWVILTPQAPEPWWAQRKRKTVVKRWNRKKGTQNKGRHEIGPVISSAVNPWAVSLVILWMTTPFHTLDPQDFTFQVPQPRVFNICHWVSRIPWAIAWPRIDSWSLLLPTCGESQRSTEEDD